MQQGLHWHRMSTRYEYVIDDGAYADDKVLIYFQKGMCFEMTMFWCILQTFRFISVQKVPSVLCGCNSLCKNLKPALYLLVMKWVSSVLLFCSLSKFH